MIYVYSKMVGVDISWIVLLVLYCVRTSVKLVGNPVDIH